MLHPRIISELAIPRLEFVNITATWFIISPRLQSVPLLKQLTAIILVLIQITRMFSHTWLQHHRNFIAGNVFVSLATLIRHIHQKSDVSRQRSNNLGCFVRSHKEIKTFRNNTKFWIASGLKLSYQNIDMLSLPVEILEQLSSLD